MQEKGGEVERQGDESGAEQRGGARAEERGVLGDGKPTGGFGREGGVPTEALMHTCLY